MTTETEDRLSRGEVIDKWTIEEILNHPQFYQIRVFRGIPLPPDYWEITYKSKTPNADGSWQSVFGDKIPTPLHVFYKTKVPK